MHEDPAYIRAAIAAGAMGYVNKSAADTELLAAIRAVVDGRVFIDVKRSPHVESPIRRTLARPGRATPLDALSAESAR